VSNDTPNSHNETDEPQRPLDAAGRDTSGQAEALDENGIPVAPAPEPVHRWLDGEPVDPADLGAPDAERHVKFWAKMKQETDRRRRLATPRGLDAVIMNKLDPPVEKDD
jgi:hypothetical protein